MKAKISSILTLLGLSLRQYMAIETPTVDQTVTAQLQEELASRVSTNSTSMLDEMSAAQIAENRLEATEADAKVTPVKNGVKFILKSAMKGHRQIFWNEHLGNGEYKLRIQNANSNNQRAWFVIDSRTKTIRPAQNQTLVISNKMGSGYGRGKPAVVRQWRGEAEQTLEFFSGSRMTVRNEKGYCLQVEEGKDVPNQPLVFDKCEDKAREGWGVSALKIVDVTSHKTPVHDGEKFLLRTRVKGGKLIYFSEKLPHNQYVLRIRSLTKNLSKAQWIFDSRTKTIRSALKRHFVISNAHGMDTATGQTAVIRPFNKGSKDHQRIYWYGGKSKNVRLEDKVCLAIKGEDKENAPLTWESCQDKPNQGWRMITIPNSPTYHAPHGDVWIRSGMKDGRALIWWDQKGSEFVLKMVSTNSHTWQTQSNNRGQFFFDERTRTIRPSNARDFCISYSQESQYRMHTIVVVAKCDNKVHQRIRYVGGNYNNIRDARGYSLTPLDDKDVEFNSVVFSVRANKCNTKWILYDRNGVVPVVDYITPPMGDDAPFRLINEHNNAQFALTADLKTTYSQDQNRLVLKETAPWDENQWFIFNRRTHTIRLAQHRSKVVSHPFEAAYFQQDAVRLSKWKRKLTQRSMYNKQKEVQDFYNFVITPNGFNAAENVEMVWYRKNNHASQRWNIETKRWYWSDYPKKDDEKFQFKTQMASKRALFWYDHIGSNQYRLRIRDNASYDLRQWWVFDSRTHTIRAFSDRNMVISNQEGLGWRIGGAAVVRPWKNEYYQQMLYINNQITDLRGSCLDVWGKADTHHNYLTFWTCHNGDNQKWNIDETAEELPQYPLRDGQRFQIKSSLLKEHVIYPLDHLGNNMYRLREKMNEPYDDKQWWIFDSRTKTIRYDKDKTKCIATYYHNRGFLYGYEENQIAIIHPYEGNHYDNVKFTLTSGGNMKNLGGFCFAPQSGYHDNNRYIMLEKCTSEEKQNWFLDPVEWDVSYPLNDDVKFQIKLSNKATAHLKDFSGSLMWHRTWASGYNYWLKVVESMPYLDEQWFVFDHRTKTIRPHADKSLAISHYNNLDLYYYSVGVVSKYTGASNQNTAWFAAKRQQIRNTADKCLNVLPLGSTQLTGNSWYTGWLPCRTIDEAKKQYYVHHIGWSYRQDHGSSWTLDTSDHEWQKFPLNNGHKFRIRVKDGNAERPVWWSSSAGTNMYWLQVLEDDLYDNRMWWVFDDRTQTIRADADRNLAITTLSADLGATNVWAIVRKYDEKEASRFKVDWWNNTKTNTIKNIAGRCLQAQSHNNQAWMVWNTCSDTALNAFRYDIKDVVFPPQPLVDGAKFQIKSRMEGNKALFYSDNYGENEYLCRVRANDPEDITQWWVFDSRTHTIRTAKDHNFVLSTYRTYGGSGQYAVVKPFTGQKNQIALWHSGAISNIQNAFKVCLDIAGGVNNHWQHVIWWSCHGNINQAWFIDQGGYVPGKNFIEENKKFFIRSRMPEGRSLYWAEDIGSYQYRLRIQDFKRASINAQWIYDHRTHSIRAFTKRNFAISHQIGYQFRVSNQHVLREWRGESFQKMDFWEGASNNLRAPSGKCLQALGNRHQQDVTMFHCKGGLDQGWYIDDKNEVFPTYPLKDGEKFVIKSKLGSQWVLMYYDHIANSNYRLRIQQNDPSQTNQWWVFDSRTHTIRLWANRNLAIGTYQDTPNFLWATSSHAVVRPYLDNVVELHTKWFPGTTKNIRNSAGNCLWVSGNQAYQHQIVYWQTCGNHDGQSWWYDTFIPQNPPKWPLNDGIPFSIRLIHEGHRSAYVAEYFTSSERIIRLQDHNVEDATQWWVRDSRTNTIRMNSDRNWVLRIRIDHVLNEVNNDHKDGTNMKYWQENGVAVAGPYRAQLREQLIWNDKYETNKIRTNPDERYVKPQCLTVSGNQNGLHLRPHLIFPVCQYQELSKWELDQNGWNEEKFPIADNIRFQIRTQMAENRAIYVEPAKALSGSQYPLMTGEYSQHEDWAWFVYDSRTRSLRADKKRDWAVSNLAGQQFQITHGSVYVQAVLRPWANEPFQKIQAYLHKDKYYSLRNPAGRCLDVRDQVNKNSKEIQFHYCSYGQSQIWFFDQTEVKYPKYPHEDGKSFSILSRAEPKRAVTWAEQWEAATYRLRVFTWDKKNAKQFWVFDSRTHTIRAFSDRNYVLGGHHNAHWSHASIHGMVRRFNDDIFQRIYWNQPIGVTGGNIRISTHHCMFTTHAQTEGTEVMFSGGLRNACDQGRFESDEQSRLQRRWTYTSWTTVEGEPPEGPDFFIDDNVKFQIKSAMDANRAVFWHEHIGSNQYRLRIRANDPENDKQWWVHDSRTNTIRPFSQRNYAISNQLGYGFQIGYAAVVRPYEDKSQKLYWYPGKKGEHVFQNLGGKCLDIAGGTNVHHQHLIFWDCHYLQNQQWIIDQVGAEFPNPPMADEEIFHIRTKATAYRSITWTHDMGAGQNYLQLKNTEAWNDNQKWVWDKRTNSIRAAHHRTHAIANRLGYDNRIQQYAVIRVWQADSYQKMAWFTGKNGLSNIKNTGGYCLSTYGNADGENTYLIFDVCHQKSGQYWFVEKNEIQFGNYPYGDNQEFQIRTYGTTNRSLYWAEHIGNNQYQLRIHDHLALDPKQWWVFDFRTHTIRSNANRNYVISVELGGHYYTDGYRAVVRPWAANDHLQYMIWNNKQRQTLKNIGGKCFDLYGAKEHDQNHVIWWACHNNWNQGWWLDTSKHEYPKFPFDNNVKFQIRSKMSASRAVAWFEHIGSEQYRLRLQDHEPTNQNQWFTYDHRTNTIRPVMKRDHVIANQLGYNFQAGVAAVIRPYINDLTTPISWRQGSVRNLYNNGGQCLDVSGASNVYQAVITFWGCHDNANQAWWLDTKGAEFTDWPVDPEQKFTIRTGTPYNMALIWHEHIGYDQWAVRTHKYQPANDNQWWIWDKRTHSIRSYMKKTYALSSALGWQMRENARAVIRPWGSQAYQQLNWFTGEGQNIRNIGGMCLSLENTGNAQYVGVIFYPCSDGSHQKFILDTKGIHYPELLPENSEFQIKNVISGRALFWHEHLGSNQYKLRVRDNEPGDSKQWFTFDKRTHTIRTAADKTLVVSVQIGGNFETDGYSAVARPFHPDDNLVKMRWYNTTSETLKNAGGKCLHLQSDSNQQGVIWMTCHSEYPTAEARTKAYQNLESWYYDTKGEEYPMYPLEDGVKFQIKSKLPHRRAVYWSTSAGQNMYYVRMRDNYPEDQNQWWMFDKRTHTIRPFGAQNYVLTNWLGEGTYVGYWAVIRAYTGTQNGEKVKWIAGKTSNIMNNYKKCLMPQSRQNSHDVGLTWWHCDNFDEQGWEIDQLDWTRTKFPHEDNVKFQIRSQMPSGRSLAWKENLGNSQLLLRIQDHAPWDESQWFTHDSRTRTIRPLKYQHMAISVQDGYHYQIGRYAVARPYVNTHFQQMNWHTGNRRNIRNNAGYCLDVDGQHNVHNRHIIFWECHDGANQGWWLDTKDVYYHKYPLNDNVKFQIKTKGVGNRALFYHEHIGSNQYLLRVRDDDPGDILQWWVFDWRTKTVRAMGNKNLAISVQLGGNFYTQNYYVVARPFVANDQLQWINWAASKNSKGKSAGHTYIRNHGGKCLSLNGNTGNHAVGYWQNCPEKGKKQWYFDWYYDEKGIEYPDFPVSSGTKFRIRSQMQYHRAITFAEHIGSNQYRLRIHDTDVQDINQWWVYDARTHTIRSHEQRTLAIANQLGYGNNPGYAVVARPYVEDNTVPLSWFHGNVGNLRNNGKNCLEVVGGTNSHTQHLTFSNCHNNLHQQWKLDETPDIHRPFPLNDTKKFQIRTVLQENRVITIWEHIGNNQYYLRLRDHLPGDKRQWFKFDHRTRTIRPITMLSHSLSNQAGYAYTINIPVVARPYTGERFQTTRWVAGKSNNIQNNAELCLQADGYTHMNYIRWQYCVAGYAHQGWLLDTTKLHYPAYPLKDGVIFQIKTRGEGNRALIWDDHLGSHQYRLRIINNDPENGRQWWVFNRRTKTIRCHQDRNKVIAVIMGGTFNDGQSNQAVVRNYLKADSQFQHIRFLGGQFQNIKNDGEKCLEVAGAYNAHNANVQWAAACSNGWHQQWYIDKHAYGKPRFPLADGVKFQLKSKLPEKRALYHSEYLGGNQYRLRIRDNHPEDLKQWFTFDKRTKTIRAWTMRDYAISNQNGVAYAIGYAAVISKFENLQYQRLRWRAGETNNIQNFGKSCLDVVNRVDKNDQPVTWWTCLKHDNQGWQVDQSGIWYPENPKADGEKFQIKSVMKDHRALFWAEHIGANQHQLRIRDSLPGCTLEWWVFDRRTHTIRAFDRRTFAISNQLGQGYQIGVAAVIRPWVGEIYQQLGWYGSNKKTIRNNGGHCLDVHGGVSYNSHNRHVTWWNCHDGENQGWQISKEDPPYPPHYYPDNHKFVLKSKLAGNRALFMSNTDMGNKNYMLRIHTNDPHDNTQWFVFDHRTRSIRLFANQLLAISSREGAGFTNGANAVMREYKSQTNQQVAYWKGPHTNLRNNVRQCLDVAGGSNIENQYTVFQDCHERDSAAWLIDDTSPITPTYPVKDGIKFQIKSLMHGHRALYWEEDIGSSQFRLRIRTSIPDYTNQWFVVDSRTMTIRGHKLKTHVISNQLGYGYTRNMAAVMRPYTGEVHQRIHWKDGKRQNIQNQGKFCLDVAGVQNVDRAIVTWWDCHQGLNQAWKVDQVSFRYPKNPITDESVKFQIKTRLTGSRALAYFEDIGDKQYMLRIQNDNPLDQKQWWKFDSRTHTIRNIDLPTYAISVRKHSPGFNMGSYAVLREYKNDRHTQKLGWFSGSIKNIRNRARQCLDVANRNPNHAAYVVWWECHNGHNQAWFIDTAGLKIEKYPFPDGQQFRIFTKMESKRVVYHNEALNKEEFLLRLRTPQPWDLREWFVFDSRSQTIRAATDRSFALAPRHGQDWTDGAQAAIRIYKGLIGSRMYFSNSKYANLRNAAGFCLRTPESDAENVALQFKLCNDQRIYQGWTVSTESEEVPEYPLQNSVKFQIKSAMTGARAAYWDEDIGSEQFRLRIRDNFPRDSKQWFIFDSRTKSIRGYSKRDYTVAIQLNAGWSQGSAVVLRKWIGDNSQWIYWESNQFKNHAKLCMDVHGGVNENKRHLIWWSCHNQLNQKWYVDQLGFQYPKPIYKNGVKFQIKSKMANWRALYIAEHIASNQYQLRIRDDKPHDEAQWWFLDSRTNTVRSWSKKTYCIANMLGHEYQNGRAVVRPYKKEPYIRLSIYKSDTKTIRNNGGKCLDVHGGVNANNQQINFWDCHNGEGQGWFTTTVIPQALPQAPPIEKEVRDKITNQTTQTQRSSVTQTTNWKWAYETTEWTTVEQKQTWEYETRYQYEVWVRNYKAKQDQLKQTKEQIETMKKAEVEKKKTIIAHKDKLAKLKNKKKKGKKTKALIEKLEKMINLEIEEYQYEQVEINKTETTFTESISELVKEKKTQEHQKEVLEEIKKTKATELEVKLKDQKEKEKIVEEVQKATFQKEEQEFKEHLSKLREIEWKWKTQLKNATNPEIIKQIKIQYTNAHNTVKSIKHVHIQHKIRQAKIIKQQQVAKLKEQEIAIKKQKEREEQIKDIKNSAEVQVVEKVIHIVKVISKDSPALQVPIEFGPKPVIALKPQPIEQRKERMFYWSDFTDYLRQISIMGEDNLWSITTIKNMYNRMKVLKTTITIKDVTRFAIEIIHARRPRSCKDKIYAEMHLMITKIVGRAPHQVKQLIDFIQKEHKQGDKLHPNIQKWIKHLEHRQKHAKPSYHDMANFVRIVVGLKKLKPEIVIDFVYRIVKPNPNAKHRHYWRRYPKLKSEYMSGLKNHAKFMIFNSQNMIVVGTTLTSFKAIQPSNYFFYDENTQAIRWLGDTTKSLGVIDLKVGGKIQLVQTNGLPARRKDMFFYDTIDMKFHNFVKRDLCISFENPKKEGESMTLAKCHCSGSCGGSISSKQEIFVKYFQFDKNNGFIPGRFFYFQNADTLHPQYLTVSNDGSYLSSSQRYVKIQNQGKITNNNLFYWDTSAKCLRNVKYKSCVGFAQQGDSVELITLGDTESLSHTLTDIRFDGQFLWLDGKVVQPQSGYTQYGGMTVSLNKLNGKQYQQWNIVNVPKPAANTAKERPVNNKKNNGFSSETYFTLNTFNGQIVSVAKNGRVTVAVARAGNTDDQFYVSKNTGFLIHRGTGLALTAAKGPAGKLVIKAKKPVDSSSFYFSRPSKAGIVQMSSNKDYIWKYNLAKNQIEVTKADGDKNWSTANSFFREASVGKVSSVAKSTLVQTTTQNAEVLNDTADN